MPEWKIGQVRIVKVAEQEITMAAGDLAADVDPARLREHTRWLDPGFMGEDDGLRISIHALVVESEDRTIVVDTCMGNDRPLPGGFGPLQTAFLAELEKVVRPEDVDLVLCTHLHFDHIGWNTRLVDGQWVPTFANARYLFARAEYEHWSGGLEHGYLDLSYGVEPIVAAGLHELVEDRHRLTGEVSLIPTPGHTPGHVSVVIRSGGDEAVITGDMVHHPVQFAEPQWYTRADGDARQSVATRGEFIDRYRDRPVLVIGTHFAGPTAGHIVGTDGATRFVADTAEEVR